MSGITFFFVFVGVASLTAQLFRFVDAVEHYTPRRRRTAAR